MSFIQNDSENTSETEEEILKEDLSRLSQIDGYARRVVSVEPDQNRQIELLKEFAQRDLSFSIGNSFAFKILARADGRQVGIPDPISSDIEIDVTEDSMVWGDVLMYQSWNLISALPKVGKSALVMGIAGAVFKGESTFLGLPISHKFDHLIIVGNDQNYKQWGKLFLREGLCTRNENNKIRLDPRIALWAQGTGIQLNEEGIDRIVKECKKRPNALILIDTLRSVTAQMGLDENKTEIQGPIRRIQDATADYGVTGVFLHHTTKSVGGGNAVIASSGSAAIPAAFDQTILMNWLKPSLDQSAQSDKRISISCMGRGLGAMLVAEIVDGYWVSHGNGEAAVHAEKISELEDNLMGRQGDAYDHVCQLWENEVHTSTTELASILNITTSKALRTLRALERKGLVKQDGVVETNEKGRPVALFKPTRGDINNGCFNTFNDFNGNKTIKDIKTPSFPIPPKVTIPALTKVERTMYDGSWQRGWFVRDGSNPHAITIERLGNQNLRIKNMRWDVDVREVKQEED